ncbi:MAG: cysteine desulfurase [Planctomycetes bacterium]|nr:cysteine desulfurase [Planctomycetota bacterium]
MSREGPIYLDFNATTPAHPRVVEAVRAALVESFGNPNSYHARGTAARNVVEGARERVARAIGARTGEVFFTSGGTEADNWAVLGAARARAAAGRARHVVTSAIEHHAVLAACERLAHEGWEVSRVACGPDGRVDPASLDAALRPDTALCSLMAANNELGTVQPVAEAARLCRGRGVLFHTDAVQAFGKLPVDVGAWGVDLLSLSAHKVYAPKGTGALYVRRGVELAPMMLGGGQERGRRSGTENVPGIAGFGEAAHLVTEGALLDPAVLAALRDRLEEGIVERLPGCVVHGRSAPRTCNTASIGFPGLGGEVLLARLDLEGVQASLGAACASGAMLASHVLAAIGAPPEVATSSVRFSLGRETTAEEVDQAVEVVARVVLDMRRRHGLA